MTATGLRLNIGCGYNKLAGYLNVDSFADCAPDLLWDLEQTPWPFEDDSVDAIHANHVLEHLGQATATFFAILKELYRVVRHDGEVRINVPHPMHESFLADPTHVRAFTGETFLMLSRSRNLDWAERRVNVTMLALMLDVNFETVTIDHVYDPRWKARIRAGELTGEQVHELSKSQIGVVHEIRARLRVDKSHRQPGGGSPPA